MGKTTHLRDRDMTLSPTRLRKLAEALGLKLNAAGMVCWNVHRQGKPEGNSGIFVDIEDLLYSPDGAFFILGEMRRMAPPTTEENVRKDFYDSLFEQVNTTDPVIMLTYMGPKEIAAAAADAMGIPEDVPKITREHFT